MNVWSRSIVKFGFYALVMSVVLLTYTALKDWANHIYYMESITTYEELK